MYNPQLETFIRVADAGSFSKAAQETFITPTAVIKQINTLEDNLDIRLFARTHRGVSLTNAGKSLYKDAQHLIRYSNDSIARAKSAMQGIENTVRIGISPKNPGQFLIELWPQLHEQYPDAQYQMVNFENTSEKAREMLKNLGRDIDIIIAIFDDEFLKTRGCAALESSKEPIRCAVPVQHRLSSKKKLVIEDLYGEDLMLIGRGWNSSMDAIRSNLRYNHKQINIVDFAYYDIGIFNKCVSSNSVIVTVDLWKDIHPLLNVLPVEWEYVIPFGLLHSPTPSETVSKFLNAVRTILYIGQ